MMKPILIRAAVVLGVLFGASSAFAQCGSSIPGGTLCGNNGASQGLNQPLTNPILGIPGTSTGQIGFAGLTSGTATIAAQSAAGTPTLLLPNTSGTLPSTAASPLVLNAVTGQLTCPTCLTASGGTLVATAPLNLTGNTLSLQGGNGTIAQGSGGTGSAFTATPTLGVAGATLGSLTFDNLTSGGITLQPTTGVLGSSVLTLPAITDTLAGKALANGGTNAALVASNGGIVWSNASQLQILAGTATARQMLQSGATATPAWSTATWPATTTAGTVLASGSANAVTATATPVLGVAGSTVGTLGFQNGTSGTITLSPATGALGTVTATLPANTGTLAETNLAQTWNAAQSFNSGDLILNGSSSGSTTVNAPATGGGTATFFPGSDTVMGVAATQSPTNKTISGSTNVLGGVTMTLGSDSTGDIYYRNSSGVLTRLGIGTSSQFLGVSGGLPAWVAAGGTGTVTSVQLTQGAGVAIATTSGANPCISTCNLTVSQSLTNATLTAEPGNPTGTTSGTGVMMGVGSTCKITPVYSGRVEFRFSGQMANATAGDGAQVQLKTGTGTAPSNGGAVSGTSLGNPLAALSNVAGQNVPWGGLGGIVTGLSVGTQVWFDLDVLAITGGTASVSNLTCTAMEF